MQGSLFERGVGSWFIGACLVIVMLPMLATSPVSGDGAELVAVALQGGVPHAPGFPVQAWLHRIVVSLPSFSEWPLLSPTTQLALFSALAHAAAAALVAETVRALGGSIAARVLAALAYALFPSTWALGVQPEVFAPTHLFIAALLWGAVRATAAPPGRAGVALWGAVFGLGLAQHPIVVVVVPAVVVGAVAAFRRSGVSSTLAAGSAALLVYVGIYATVPALRSTSPWPDWGAVQHVDDIARLALRSDYGTTRLFAGSGAAEVGVVVLLRAVWPGFVPVLVLAAIGAWSLRRRRAALLAVLGTAVAALLFLCAARFPAGIVVATAFLERFQGLFVLPAAVLAGLGTDRVAGAVVGRARLVGGALAGVVAASMYFGGFSAADASARHELTVLRFALGASLPADAAWLAGTDAEVFGGALALRDDSTLMQRWPIAAHLLGLSWYREHTLPMVQPDLPWSTSPRPLSDAAAVASFARARGRPVASTDRALAEASGAPARLDGLIWIADGSDGDELTWRTVEGALILCPWIEELESMPDEVPAFGRGTWTLFARAFDGASHYLERVDPQAGEEAAWIARSLEARSSTPAVAVRCSALQKRVQQMRPDLRKSLVDDPNRPRAE